MAEDAWVMHLINMATNGGPAQQAAAIRQLWVHHGWTVEEINDVCSVDLAVIRHALTHAPIVRGGS